VTLIVVTQDSNLCPALMEALDLEESNIRVVSSV